MLLGMRAVLFPLQGLSPSFHAPRMVRRDLCCPVLPSPAQAALGAAALGDFASKSGGGSWGCKYPRVSQNLLGFELLKLCSQRTPQLMENALRDPLCTPRWMLRGDRGGLCWAPAGGCEARLENIPNWTRWLLQMCCSGVSGPWPGCWGVLSALGGGSGLRDPGDVPGGFSKATSPSGCCCWSPKGRAPGWGFLLALDVPRNGECPTLWVPAQPCHCSHPSWAVLGPPRSVSSTEDPEPLSPKSPLAQTGGKATKPLQTFPELELNP